MEANSTASSTDRADADADAEAGLPTSSCVDGQASDHWLVSLDYGEEEERKVMRKVDSVLVPILTLL